MKKFFRFLFHRAVLTALSLFMQIILIIGIINRFREDFVFFYAFSIVLSIIVVILIINSDMNTGYKVAWMIPLLLFPVFGSFFYLFFGGKRLSKRVKAKMRSIETSMQKHLPKDKELMSILENTNPNAAKQSKYLQDYAFSPPYDNTYTEYLPLGEVKFKRLKEELEKAERFIFMEYFIISEGRMWDEILEILKRKVDEGVEVRIMYDDVGCITTLPYAFDQQLRDMGIQSVIFNPFAPILSSKLNNRDHRKIAVIDGHTGFTGGINIGDEYINELIRFGHWKDTSIMLKGEAVWSLTVMFLTVWDYVNDTEEDYAKYKPKLLEEKGTHNGFVQPFTDNPMDDEPVGESVYLNLINRAKRYVYITTPYLIIDSAMEIALSVAAKSGVDVRIITPSIADKRMVHSMTRSYYPTLIKSGVKIYEYTPGFIHSKSFVVDDEYAVIGTINLDYRSLYLHYECGVWLYNTDTIYDIKKDYLGTLELSREVTAEDMERIPFYKIVGRSILRVFAPLM